MPDSALIIVDGQYDFIWGSMGAVSRTYAVPYVLSTIKFARASDTPIYASLDWHPKDHCSFFEQGGPFPMHTVHHTYGAGLIPEIVLNATKLLRKGTRKDRDALSAFDGTGLNRLVRDIETLTVIGWCTDFCVLATVLDAIKEGHKVDVIRKAVAAVDDAAGKAALEQMADLGARIL